MVVAALRMPRWWWSSQPWKIVQMLFEQARTSPFLGATRTTYKGRSASAIDRAACANVLRVCARESDGGTECKADVVSERQAPRAGTH